VTASDFAIIILFAFVFFAFLVIGGLLTKVEALRLALKKVADSGAQNSRMISAVALTAQAQAATMKGYIATRKEMDDKIAKLLNEVVEAARDDAK
jgi:hypothetical protein